MKRLPATRLQARARGVGVFHVRGIITHKNPKRIAPTDDKTIRSIMQKLHNRKTNTTEQLRTFIASDLDNVYVYF